MLKKFSFSKKEKLKSRKQLAQLFATGKYFTTFPVKIFFIENQKPEAINIKIGVGVSSRNFKKAVERNRIKRLLRETYRVNKMPLVDFIDGNKKNVSIFFLYIDKVMPTHVLLKSKMPVIIDKLIKQLSETSITNT